MADRDELAQQAGFTVSFFRSNSELWDIFQDALSERWDPSRLVTAIRNSDWFASTPESERRAQLLEHSDPAEYQARREKIRAEVLRISRETGLGWGIQDGALHAAADKALLNNWSDQQIRQHLASLGSIEQRMKDGKTLTGDAGAAERLVRQLAQDYGIKISDSRMRTMVANMASGQWDENFARNWFIGKAKGQYAALEEELDAGFTVRQAAEPFVDTMAQLLELNGSDIGLDDPMIRRALTRREGLENLTDFENRVRQDSRWMRTDNARESMMSAGREILKLFGQVS